MSFVNSIYNNVFRRTSTFALACLVGAFGFERAFDVTATSMFESMNRGKMWKHICHKYEKEEE
ncbi:Cytochrome b-c1 complex subunit 9 [Orchesella cincta]|uniref:Complex III subunit 9 n=1 Tax=Orchesella cincta TaxID=48709 RepID=A0A1D2NHN3_ORCCI|nr:Cytochrome b-c1 complex subunit 9 [Orchesella cincta]